MKVETLNRYETIVDEIDQLNWRSLATKELMAVCRGYYYFFKPICPGG